MSQNNQNNAKMPEKYKPEPRLVDKPAQLHRLLIEEDLGYRAASERMDVSKSTVRRSAEKHGIKPNDDDSVETETQHSPSPDWTKLND
jgi:hypothetical protein